jgi:hypothetical protein
VNKQGTTTPSIDGGSIYIAGTKGEIVSLDAVTGAVQWNIATSCMRSYATSVLLTDDHLYVQTYQGLVECRLRSNGSLLWSYQTDSYGLGNMALGDDGIYATSDDRCIHKLDKIGGGLIWKKCFVGNFARSGAFYHGGLIFASGCTGEYYGVDSSGNTVFGHVHGAGNSFTDWAEADGLLYVTNLGGVMHCFAPNGVPGPAACTPGATPSYSPTHSPSSTPTATESSTPSASPSFSPTLSATPTASATPTVTSSSTPSLTVTDSPTASHTPAQSPVPTPGHDELPGGHDPGDIGDDEGVCYPNPVKDGRCRIAFRMKEPGKSKIRVFSADGGQAGSYRSEHSSTGLKSVQCDVSGYAPGVYFFIVDREGHGGRTSKTKLGKFIVIR